MGCRGGRHASDEVFAIGPAADWQRNRPQEALVTGLLIPFLYAIVGVLVPDATKRAAIRERGLGMLVTIAGKCTTAIREAGHITIRRCTQGCLWMQMIRVAPKFNRIALDHAKTRHMFTWVGVDQTSCHWEGEEGT